MKLREPYPCSIEEWENPENTVFLEFYIKSSYDWEILEMLVEQKNMTNFFGSCGVEKCRLLHLIRSEKHRAYYIHSQQRKYPYSWRLRWWWRNVRLFVHRMLKTKHFKNQVELCKISKGVVEKMQQEQKQQIDTKLERHISFLETAETIRHAGVIMSMPKIPPIENIGGLLK